MNDGRGSRGAAAVFLLGAGGAWNAGNVGGVVAPVAADFDISLAAVGLLSGTLLLAFSVPATILAPRLIGRIGVVRVIVASALAAAVANLVFAIAGGVAVASVARVIAGLALGMAVVAGPVFARETGGVARVGLFGAAIQLGIAGGIGVGAVLGDLDVDWRASFAISAAVGASPLPFILGTRVEASVEARARGFLRLALRSSRVYRLLAGFIAFFSVPLILGSWLVHFLSVDSGIAAATAGVLSFVMFGISAAAREAGGVLSARGVSPALLVGGFPLLAAAGLATLALDDSVGAASLAVVLAGVGFAVPYSTAMLEAQRLFPADPAAPTALVSVVGTAVPVPLIPLIGSLLDEGEGAAVFLTLAAFVALAGILNLRPVEGALAERPVGVA